MVEFSVKRCPMCDAACVGPEGEVFRLPGDEVETMADGIAVLNEVGHRGTRTWGVYLAADGSAMAMNRVEFTALDEFEVVAIARRYKREKGA